MTMTQKDPILLIIRGLSIRGLLVEKHLVDIADFFHDLRGVTVYSLQLNNTQQLYRPVRSALICHRRCARCWS